MANHVKSWTTGAIVHFGTLRFLVTDDEDLLWERPAAAGTGAGNLGRVTESLADLRLNDPEQ